MSSSELEGPTTLTSVNLIGLNTETITTTNPITAATLTAITAQEVDFTDGVIQQGKLVGDPVASWLYVQGDPIFFSRISAPSQSNFNPSQVVDQSVFTINGTTRSINSAVAHCSIGTAGGVVVVNSLFNIQNVTRLGAGQYNVVFTTPINGAYSVVCGVNSLTAYNVNYGNQTNNSVDVYTSATTGILGDPIGFYLVIFLNA